MPTRFYEPVAGDLKLWADPDTFVEEDLQAELDELLELQALSEEARDLTNCPELTRDDFDTFILSKIDMLKDILDFFNYDNKPLALNVKDGIWFTPIAIESVCGEEPGQEATLTIDGFNNTYWEDRTDEPHNIIWQLRDYKKRMSKLRVRVGSSSRNLLTGVDIYIADTVGALDNPGRLVVSGLDLVVPNSWEEIDLGSKWNGRYIRFTGFGSTHASNQVRIQEIQAWVTTVEYN